MKVKAIQELEFKGKIYKIDDIFTVADDELDLLAGKVILLATKNFRNPQTKNQKLSNTK